MNKLIIFAEDWAAHPSSTQHLAKYLQYDNEIIWVNSVGMRAPAWSLKDMTRLLRKALMMGKSLITQPVAAAAPPRRDKLTVINPVCLPWHNIGWVNSINRWLINRALGKRQANERRTYWLTLPTAQSLLPLEHGDNLVYYCCDDFYALDGVDAQMIAKWEPKLIDKADLILATSKSLLQKFPKGKALLLEHGVDYQLFSQPVSRHPQLHGQRPMIGFYGSISAWLDVDLLTQLAERNPQWDLMLVGQIKTDVSKLQPLANVHFVNAVPHEHLPQFSQHWDVLLMPFKHNQQIEACNPLKLREYLAAGRPVVSTNFPAAQEYKDVVSIATTTDEFIAKVSAAVLLSDYLRTVLQGQQRDKVADQDWSNKAKQVSRWLASLSH